MSSLKEVVVSRASAKQRMGRAGRVRPGHCWRLYSQEFLESALVHENPTPEIRRVPLQEVVLQVLLLKFGLPDVFLSQCLEPPSMSQVRTSVNILLDIKAVLPERTLPLTALGYHLAQMPVDVRIGKMLITASLLNCVEPALTIAATLAGKSPFVFPPNKREESDIAHNSFTSSYNYTMTAEKYQIALPFYRRADSHYKRDREDLTPPNDVFFSDHLACVNAYNLWEKIYTQYGVNAAYSFCREKYLSHPVLSEMMKLRDSFKSHLRSAGFLPPLPRTNGTDNEEDEDEDDDSDRLVVATASSTTSSVLESDPRSNSLSPSESSYGIMRCALCAALYPQVVRVIKVEDQARKAVKKGTSRKEKASLRIVQGDGAEVHVHPSSLTAKYVKYVLEGGQGAGQGQGQKRSKDAYIVYHKKMATTRTYLHDCTVVPAAAILLFGGEILISRIRKGQNGDAGVTVTVGSWIHFKMNELHAVLFRRLQWEIELLLRMKVEDPLIDVTKKQAVLVKVIETLLE